MRLPILLLITILSGCGNETKFINKKKNHDLNLSFQDGHPTIFDKVTGEIFIFDPKTTKWMRIPSPLDSPTFTRINGEMVELPPGTDHNFIRDRFDAAELVRLMDQLKISDITNGRASMKSKGEISYQDFLRWKSTNKNSNPPPAPQN